MQKCKDEKKLNIVECWWWEKLIKNKNRVTKDWLNKINFTNYNNKALKNLK